MQLGELIYNKEFDIEAPIKIYEGDWKDGRMIWEINNSTMRMPVIHMSRKIKKITVDLDNHCIIIEIY